MEEMITHIAKFLSHNIMVHIYSYPQFSIETFLAAIVCVVHCLLIFEVNSLYRRTNAKAAAKLRMRHQATFKEVESCSYHTISRVQTQIFPQKIETMTTRQSFYIPPYKRIGKKTSVGSNFSWAVSQADSLLHNFNDRVEHLLSISPSEYVRKDRERKNREVGLRSCIQSLTSLLEKALNTDNLELENLSKDAIKHSINALRENFERQISRENYSLGEFGSSSIQSLIADSVTKKTLRSCLSPHLLTRNQQICEKNYNKKNEDREDSNDGDCIDANDFINELFEEKTIKVLHGTEKIPLPT